MILWASANRKASHLSGIILSVFCFGILAGAGAAGVEDLSVYSFFEKEVRPLLVEHCQGCHGADQQQGGLRLEQIAEIQKGGNSGPAIVSGEPEHSLLVQVLRKGHSDASIQATSKLTPAEIDALERWIRIGAPWPEGHSSQESPSKGTFTAEDRNYWFFQPLKQVVPPQAGADWGRVDLDRFIARKLEQNGLKPAPEASREEWIRRIYFDLHGLPPTYGQIQSFVKDPDPLAHEKLVDELLASPRYGERWAQHWLDLVRYAESDGYNQDAYRPEVWRYRDYVIRSLNDDKPYDQFLREQLAGDELDPEDPDVLIATAFLRHPVYEYNLRDVRGQWEVILTDITDTTAEVFLGLSMGCARCHDHKFDPILQEDYYRLRAFFTPIHWRDDLPYASRNELQDFKTRQAEWEAATAKVRAKLDELTRKPIESRVETWRASFPEDLQAMTHKPIHERNALEKQLAGLCERQLAFAKGQFNPATDLKTDEDKQAYKTLQAELKQKDSLKPKPLPVAFVATDAGSQAPPNRLSTRQGERDIAPGFPSILDPSLPEIHPTEASTGRRRALADWMAGPAHALTSRVIVNRIYQYHFGKGLVASSSEFGRLGEPPSHPDLLDYLADRFLASGWRLKELHREMVLSSTYRQTARVEPSEKASLVDPSNRFLWRFQPRRLDAEQVRDAMLVASGDLDLKLGGPSSDGNGTRRSIYTIKKRNRPHDLLFALDMPAGFASTSERQSTTTATQALQLLNGDWLLARSRKIAQAVDSLDEAWLKVLGRSPTPEEKHGAGDFLKKRMEAVGKVQAGQIDQADSSQGGAFKIGSPRERLIVTQSEKEGDDFTVEALVKLDSIDVNAELRTLVSHWNGGKGSLESFGWSIDVTGKKSRYQPNNILMQLVGEDENANIGYQVVASNLRMQVGRRYHLLVNVASSREEIVFRMQDLETPGAALQEARVSMERFSNLSGGASPIVLGGLSLRRPTRQWDGVIEALRVMTGKLPGDALPPDARRWEDGIVVWRATDAPNRRFAWSGADGESSGGLDPRQQAMADLCQVLLNSNEFFYLH